MLTKMKVIHAFVLNAYQAFVINIYHLHDLFDRPLKNCIIFNLNTLASSEAIIPEIRALVS